jgi:hypothetical protein
VTDSEVAKHALLLLEASFHNGTPRLTPMNCVRLVATIDEVAASPWMEKIREKTKLHAENALAELQTAVETDEKRRVDAETEAARKQADIVGAVLNKSS